MTTWWRVAWLLAATCATSGTLPACRSEPRACIERESGDNPIDPTLLAFLSRARSAHHLADIQEEGDPQGAIRSLLAIVDGPVPENRGTTPAEAREVLADTEARLADLRSREKQFDDALRHVARGLKWVPEVSYFRGHLFETQGLVEQRSADESTRRGRENDASAAKVRALTAFETAMEIQAAVIRTAPPSGSDSDEVERNAKKDAAAAPVPPASSQGTLP